MGTFNVYISKENQKWFDQLVIICRERNMTISEGIMQGIQWLISET